VSLPDAAAVETEAELTGERERSLVLLPVDAAGDLLVLAVLADLAGDVVLRHEVHIRARAELLGDEAQDRLGLFLRRERPPERDQSVVGFAQVPKRTCRIYLQRYHSVSDHG
jgi:hypothetical protein